MAYHLTTTNGYDFWEVTSALIKSLRRGQEEQALFWALGLAGQYDEFLWKRLAIFTSEDIGPADNSMAVLIDVLAVNYRDLRKQQGRPQERIILAHAIIGPVSGPEEPRGGRSACFAAQHYRDAASN